MKYIINVGHKTRSGPDLSARRIENELSFHFRITSHNVVTSEYQGEPEETSVLRFESLAPVASVLRCVGASSDVLDQECIAVAHYGTGSCIDKCTAHGVIVGANPSDITFDFDYFRI